MHLPSDILFMTDIINSLVTDREFMLPSEYVESVRYLPKELSPKHGFFDYDWTPYFREPVNNFSPLSNVREIVFMKSAQIGATTGLLESIIAYYIGHVARPQLYVSADKELVSKGMEVKVDRMLDNSGLRDLIKPQTGVKTRKTGDTKTEKDYPGGFLHAIGAQNPGKLRSMNYPVLLFDELDAFPMILKNEGDPIDLAKNRTLIPYEDIAKILYLTTPLITQTSKIYPLYLQGDQRHYYVPCIHCGEYIVLHWHLRESETKSGLKSGIIFDTLESGKLIRESVKYKCQECGGEMENHHKSIILIEGEWRPTAEATKDRLRSYWINALYSPVGMFSWAGMAESFLDCWDVKTNKVKDREKYRGFRNTKEGKPFEEMGEAPKYEKIIPPQRHYPRNAIPNKMCIEDNGHPILFLIASVDVQKTCLFLDIKGYTVGGKSYTIDFRQIDGSPENKNDVCWNTLEDIIDHERWKSDDGKIYHIQTTFIDAAWGETTSNVYAFCEQYTVGVYPQFGERWLTDGMVIKAASNKTIEKAGCMVYKTNTTLLKDRIANSFKIDWNTGEKQPEWRPNFPEDLRDDYFRQFEAEYKAPLKDKLGVHKGFAWVPVDHRKPNHAFDTFVYNFAALEQFAESVCLAEKYDEAGNEVGLELEYLHWPSFWEFAATRKYYMEAA